MRDGEATFATRQRLALARFPHTHARVHTRARRPPPPHPFPPPLKTAGVSSQLAEVVKAAQAQANQGKKLLDAIKKEGEDEMRRNKKSARIQPYTAQYTRLCKVYVDAMKEHQRAKEALRKTQVDGVVRQGMALPQNENKSEAEVRREVELAGPAAFLQSALMEEASDEAQAAYLDAESRAKDIDLLMRSINDVAALFQDLAVLVQAQSAQLDTIEVHVEAASKHIRKGNEAVRGGTGVGVGGRFSWRLH